MLVNKRMLRSTLAAVVAIAFTFSSAGVASAAENMNIPAHHIVYENTAHDLSEAKEMLSEAETTHDLGEEISVKNLATTASQVNDIQRGISPDPTSEPVFRIHHTCCFYGK